MEIIDAEAMARKVASDSFNAGWRACLKSMRSAYVLGPSLTVERLLDIADDALALAMKQPKD